MPTTVSTTHTGIAGGLIRIIKLSTCGAAEGAGLTDTTLCRKLVAELFEPIWDFMISFNTIPQRVSVIKLTGLISLWNCPTAHANAAEVTRSALPAVEESTGFSKSKRDLTEHNKIEYMSAFNYGDSMNINLENPTKSIILQN